MVRKTALRVRGDSFEFTSRQYRVSNIHTGVGRLSVGKVDSSIYFQFAGAPSIDVDRRAVGGGRNHGGAHGAPDVSGGLKTSARFRQDGAEIRRCDLPIDVPL